MPSETSCLNEFKLTYLDDDEFVLQFPTIYINDRMIFVIPLGSDMYLETVGYYALYLSTPLVVYVIVNEIRRYNLMSAKLFCLFFFLLFK